MQSYLNRGAISGRDIGIGVADKGLDDSSG